MADIDQSMLSIPVSFEKIEEYTIDDSRFTKVKIWLMHLGENKNKSIFEKEIVDAALPTLEYIPIVGFIEKNKSDENDFSNHRNIIVKDKNGYRREYLGHAYGVVLSSQDNDAHYEFRVCDDGIEREFLVCNGVIWNMFENAQDIMKRDLVKGHSMELKQDTKDSYSGYLDEDGKFHFTKFSFRAACILGEDYEAGMHSSTIEVQFTMNDFVRDLQREMNDKLATFTKMVNENNNQGGIGTMQITDFTQTVMGQFTDISNMVKNHESTRNRWGEEVPRYYMVDIQENEVIVVDVNDNYNYYGFSFTVNGDKADIDFTTGNRKKLRYEQYEDGVVAPEAAFSFGNHIAEIESAAFAKVEDANNKANEFESKANEFELAKTAAETNQATAETNYNDMKAEFDKIKPLYDEFVRADEERKENELNAQKDAKFAEYEEILADNVEYVALKDRKNELSVDDIEKECAVLYVKECRMAKTNFTKTNSGSTVVVGIIEDHTDDNFVETTRYGRVPVKNRK